MPPIPVAPTGSSATPPSIAQGASANGNANGTTPTADVATASDPAAHYRAALRVLTQRDYRAAVEQLTEFLHRFPTHAYVPNALYWRAEAQYALGDYSAAKQGFNSVLSRFPNSTKTPDALLKLGLCHRRMGELDEAREVFHRVKVQFPHSTAAQLASQEDAS